MAQSDEKWDNRRLQLLKGSDPARAAEVARKLLVSGEMPVIEVAGVLVDVGEDGGDPGMVAEGLAALRTEGERAPQPNLEYLIGTAD